MPGQVWAKTSIGCFWEPFNGSLARMCSKCEGSTPNPTLPNLPARWPEWSSEVAGSDGKWSRVSRQHPCPICGKPDNCEVSADGRVVWCGRIPEGSLRQNAGGQFLHRLNDTDQYKGQDRRCVHTTPRKKPQ